MVYGAPPVTSQLADGLAPTHTEWRAPLSTREVLATLLDEYRLTVELCWKQSQGFRTALRLLSRSFMTFSTLSASTPASFSASRKCLRNLSKCPSFNPCSRACA
jgi:hypothetical protein